MTGGSDFQWFLHHNYQVSLKWRLKKYALIYSWCLRASYSGKKFLKDVLCSNGHLYIFLLEIHTLVHGKWIDLEYTSISKSTKYINAQSKTVAIFWLRRNDLNILRIYLYFQHPCFNGQYESAFYDKMFWCSIQNITGFLNWLV